MQNESPIKLIRLVLDFSAPLSSVILMIFGSAFFTTYLSLYLDSVGYTSEQIGFIHSAFFMGMFLGAFRMEALIKRVGHIQALAVFGSLASSTTLIQALVQTFPAWIFLRFLSGLSLAALYIVIESWMLNRSDLKSRGVVLSLYMICLYAAQSMSQQVLSFVDIQSTSPYLLSAIFTSLGIIPIGLSKKRIELPPVHEEMSFLQIVKISPFGCAGCVIAGLIISSIYSFFPLFSLSREIPSENLMSITIAGGVMLQWPIGKLSDYFERRKTLLTVVLITLGLSFLTYTQKEATTTQILVLSFLIGGFTFTLYPLSITQVCDHLDYTHVTTATALLLISFGFGSVLGPIISSSIVESFGINAIFLYFSGLLGILGGVGAFITLQRPIVPLDEQVEFQPLPNLTPVVNEMDPRSEDLSN